MLGTNTLPEQGWAERKARGAYFTPAPIAAFLVRWAIAGRGEATVLDPTCGDGAFLLEACAELSRIGVPKPDLPDHVWGYDLHPLSLEAASQRLAGRSHGARLGAADFFNIPSPADLFGDGRSFDAVVGNPPFVRYQNHRGTSRAMSRQAALRQGVRLSGLASSWAATLVHAASFLSPTGRLAMVLPAELLTVGYAEPIRQWLRQRFAHVKLVIFERLQFEGALENVVLLLAHGSGGCDAFSLYYVEDGEELGTIQPFEEYAVTLGNDSKWTDLLLTVGQRQVFKSVAARHFVPLGEFGSPTLGTVTGANDFFTLAESTRAEFGLIPDQDVRRVCPPGTKHLKGLSFSQRDWQRLKDAGEAVWLLQPTLTTTPIHEGLRRYLEIGERNGVPLAYKCQIRNPWWRPPSIPPPDLFFTYMSHRFPRLFVNTGRVTFLNSMHGISIRSGSPACTAEALPLLSLNSATMLGAEMYGRSYGGGVLKMEPREAATLPVPRSDLLQKAWVQMSRERKRLERELAEGRWTTVVARVDEVLLKDSMGLDHETVAALSEAGKSLRRRRLARSGPDDA